MSLKKRLVEKFGEKEAMKMLSDHGREMSAKVKNRYKGFGDPKHQALAQKRRAEKRAEHNKAVEGLKD